MEGRGRLAGRHSLLLCRLYLSVRLFYCLSVSVAGRVEERARFTQRYKLSLRRVIMKPLCAASHVVMGAEAAIVSSGTVGSADGAVPSRDGTRRRGGKNWRIYQRKTSVLKNPTRQIAPRQGGKTASESSCREITGDGCFQYLPLQKEISQRGEITRIKS